MSLPSSISMLSVDIVMCLDISKNFKYLIDDLKASLLRTNDIFDEHYQGRGTDTPEVRVKIITFGSDPDKMEQSKFFVPHDEQREFNDYLNGLHATDEPSGSSCTLDALALAMKIHRDTSATAKRQFIIMLTDSLLVEAESSRPQLADGSPRATFNDVKALWEGLPKRSKRIILYCPESPITCEIEEWPNTYVLTPKPGPGYFDTDTIIVLAAYAG